ncbi:MAG TPA: metalloregulator ArsR/SmtB family transcription factor [Pseudonocardiaceae bacterium]
MGESVYGRDPLPSDTLRAASDAFGLLAAPARLHILWLLCDGELDVGSLAALVGGTVQATSQHLAKLRAAGMVCARRDGRHQMYRVDDPDIAAVVRRVVDRPDTNGADTNGAGQQPQSQQAVK